MSASEFVRARQLAQRLAPAQAGHLVVPNGDDAAVLMVDGALVATTDMVVSGQDFTGAWPWDAVGHKALAQNLSDLAAMGAAPVGYLLAISAPGSLPEAAWDGLAEGMLALQQRHRVGCVGGDLSATSGPLTLAITALGQVPPGAVLRRSGARPGDTLFVTGALGGAAAGVRWWLSHPAGTPLPAPGTPQHHALRAQGWPEPRIPVGLALRGVATACVDVSDGLIQDLCHLLVTSGVGARLDEDALPRHPGVAWLSPEDALAAVLGGGEDFELVFTAPDDGAVRAVAQRTGVACTAIGRVTESRTLELGGVVASAQDVETLHQGERPANAEVARWRGFSHRL